MSARSKGNNTVTSGVYLANPDNRFDPYTALDPLPVNIEGATVNIDPSGLATDANQETLISYWKTDISNNIKGDIDSINVNTASMDAKLTVGDDDTLATALQTVVYGRKDATPSGLRALKTDFEGRLMIDIDQDTVGLATEATLKNIDTKITSGKDDSITGDLQQNLVYGRYDANGDLKAVKCSSDGSVITAPVGAQIISSDGTTSEQRVMILGNYNGNLRTVKVGQDGELITEIDHSWDNTNVPINNQNVADGASTSGNFDLGQGVSHEIGNLEIFVTNSALVQIDIAVEVSPDGTNWYVPYNGFPISTTNGAISFSQENIGATIGNRYFRFTITNNDGFGTSTDVTLTVAYYK